MSKTASPSLAKSAPVVQISDLQRVALQQLALIRRLENESALRALLVGFALHQIKGSLKHGEFLPWVKKNLDSSGYRQANYYMRFASAFREAVEPAEKEVAAIVQHDHALSFDQATGPAQRFVTRAVKFIDGRSLNECLDDLGIKDAGKLGGARARDAAKKHAAPDAEQLYLFARDEIGGVIQRAEELFLKENRLQHLVGHPEEVRGVVESLRTLADKVEAAAKPLIGKKG